MSAIGNKITDERELTITRIFDAPRELVFRMWSEATHLRQWSAPNGFTIPENSGELRPGGHWRCHMRAPDGSGHVCSGVYREIVVPERLVFTHGWEDGNGTRGHETLVTVVLEEHNGKTRMTFHQALFASVADRDGHQIGWSESFDRLADYLQQTI